MTTLAERERALARLQAAQRRCTRCVDAGALPVAHPVFHGGAGQRILLVGQAPGPVEQDQSRPFAGRAGRQLMRWFARAGVGDEERVRELVYMTSMTTCFPGRSDAGTGDRRPSAREVSLCAPWLDSLLPLLQPRLILPVGGLALSRFMPGRSLDDVVGSAFDSHLAPLRHTPSLPPALLPLPHPSGQSRWLNDPARRSQLELALQRLRVLARWATAAAERSGSGSGPML